MEEKITYRDAKIDDLPKIVDIYNSTIPGRMVTADMEPVSVESRKKWFAEHSPSSRPIWVMEYEAEVCGWVSFSSFYGRPAYNGTVEISIYLDERFRGKGLGKHAIQQAIEVSPELQVHTILAFIFGHNEPSLRLFETFGFEKWAHLPRVAEMEGIERDLIILGKRVDE